LIGSEAKHDALEDKIARCMEEKPSTVTVERQIRYGRGVMDVVWFKRNVHGKMRMRYYEVKSGRSKAGHQAKNFYKCFGHIERAKMVLVTPSGIRRIDRNEYK